MLRHPIRKILCLTILYSIIIVGIFVLQFKNESVISRNIGLLRMSVAQTQTQEGSMLLKNNMQVSFKGISFTADDIHPLFFRNSNSPETHAAVLTKWEQPTEFSYKFFFNDNISLTFAVSDTTPQAILTMSAQIPDHIEQISLSYKPASGYSATERIKTRQLISSKNTVYVIHAPSIEDDSISFTQMANVASYSLYEAETKFTFESVSPDFPLASQSAYEDTLKKIRNGVGSLFANTQDATAANENAIVAYIAEQASQGQYNAAISRIPDTFRRSPRRTYISAPFFNSLVTMNQSLTMANENLADMIKNAIAQNSMDIFSITMLADYMLREDTNTDVRTLASLPASLTEFAPTLEQATGILQTYTKLAKAHSVMASWLEPIIQMCLDTIENACSLTEDTLLQLTEQSESVPFMQRCLTGKALLDYGLLTNIDEYAICGRMIINTAFTQNTPDSHALTELYPLLIDDNPFYPHYEILNKIGGSTIWAWTSARAITYEENSRGSTATITVDFPLEEAHYIILKGIRPFSRIEIYGLSFHTDPRFESYNSSGYVYNEQTQTLFLKSRHKSEKEVINLTFKAPRVSRTANVQPAQPSNE